MNGILRMVAVLLVGVALIPRPPARHERVLVVALDGARLSTMQRLADAGILPNVAGLLGSSAGGLLYGGSRRDPRGFWRFAFAGGSSRNEPVRYVWQRATGAQLRAAAVGLPETDELVSPTALVVPGADEVSGFIGDNAGHVISASVVEAGKLGWPYAASAERVAQELSTLAAGSTSPWIAVELAAPDKRTGMFRMYRLDDDAVYLSPVYRSATLARKYVPTASESLVYVADDPAWTVDSSRLRDYFYRHVRDLTGARAELTSDLLATRWQLFVYFDPLLGLTEQAYSADPAGSEGSDVLEDAYRTIDARIGRLRLAAGPRTAIVLLGREPAAMRLGHEPMNEDAPVTTARAMTGFFFAGDGTEEAVFKEKPVRVWRVSRTLLHLLGIGSTDKRPPIATVVARFPHRAPSAHSEEPPVSRQALPLTPDSLRQLGLLSDSTRAPAAETAEASTSAIGK